MLFAKNVLLKNLHVPSNPMKICYICRSDISWYSRNANAYQKPLMLSEAFDLTLVCPQGTTVPDEIAAKCRVVQVACGDVQKGWSLWKVMSFMKAAWRAVFYCNNEQADVATGFDMPCLILGWLAKRRLGARWIVFCWDPPALSWRDKGGVLARIVVMGVDGLFRFLVKDADRLVLNIHPGLLDEMGYCPKKGQLLSMPNGYMPLLGQDDESTYGDPWLIGVLSNAATAKGFHLVLDAFIALATEYPRLRFIWIGDVAEAMRLEWSRRLEKAGIAVARYVLTGKIPQQEAFRTLSGCGILLHPYLAVPSLKWNYPLKVVEYMSLGRALVASDLPGVSQYIRNQENGLLFKAGDAKALSTLLRTIAENEAEQRRLGKQAQQDAKNFEWPKLNLEMATKVTEGMRHG
jgi:glycosyltransferase involved in cell wall biosynthesis